MWTISPITIGGWGATGAPADILFRLFFGVSPQPKAVTDGAPAPRTRLQSMELLLLPKLSLRALCGLVVVLGGLLAQGVGALNLELCLCNYRGSPHAAARLSPRNPPFLPQILVRDTQGEVVETQRVRLHASGNQACYKLHLSKPERAHQIVFSYGEDDSLVLSLESAPIGTRTRVTTRKGSATLKICSEDDGATRATVEEEDEMDGHCKAPTGGGQSELSVEPPLSPSSYSPAQDQLEDEFTFVFVSSAVALLILWLTQMSDAFLAASSTFTF